MLGAVGCGMEDRAIRRWKTHRTAAVLAACAIHAVLLATLAMGIPWTPKVEPPAPALELTLQPPPPETPPPPTPRNGRRKPSPAQSPPTRSARLPALSAPPPAAINLPPGPAAGGDDAGNIRRTLRATVGCARPDAIGLSKAERVACRQQVRALLGEVPALSGIPAAKRAGYERAAECTAARDAPIPPGHAESNGAAGIPGLGDQSRMRDCPPLTQ
jgi:hypothetical protein